MKAELIPTAGGPPIPLTKDVTVIGRREYCDVQIDDPSLSKRHCVLVKTDGLLVIRDLATTNGTKVKGQKIRWAALLPEDRIALGGIKFKIYLGPDDVPSPSELAAKGLKAPVAATNRLVTAIPVAVPFPPMPKTAPRPPSDDDVPLILDEGAWRDAIELDDEDEEIIELG